MGADWVKFRIRPEVAEIEVRELASFVNANYPHGRWLVKPQYFVEDEVTLARCGGAIERLKSLLIFPKDTLDYWSHIALTDPPGMNLEVALCGRERVVPQTSEVDACRVYVISFNPVFPVEWRDEAYRSILPNELRDYLNKWRNYVSEVQDGQWQQYVCDLYLFDRVNDEHQFQEFENLVGFATESLARTNAWCQKKELAPVRERILRFDALERLKRIQNDVVPPTFAHDLRNQPATVEQLRKAEEYWELCQSAAVQIQEWNRLVPKKWKVQYPVRESFADFLGHADSRWLKGFFEWCGHLQQDGYGLFLWA